MPTVPLRQPAAFPDPGAKLVRSKWIVPAVVLKVTKSATGRVPIVTSLMVPPVSPTNEPLKVLLSPGTNVFAPFILVKLMLVVVTVASPPISPEPVTLVARAGVTKAAILKATKLKRE